MASIHRVLQRANLLRSHKNTTQRIISTKPIYYHSYESPPSKIPTIHKQQQQQQQQAQDDHNATNVRGTTTTVRRNGVVATVFATPETARRSFSSVSENVESRAVPTRHSRHHLPEVGPFDSLEGLSTGLLDAVPGTLFVYDAVDLQLTKDEEYENGLARSYETQQLVEYILRGYNITFPNSLVQNTHPKSVTDQRLKEEESNNYELYVTTLEKMIALLDRIELEGSVYVELRSNFRSQLAHRNANDSYDTTTPPPTDTDTDTDTDTFSNAQNQQDQSIIHLNNTYGAPPGPSTLMYDLILDAISLTIPHLPPPSAVTWIRRSLQLSERARNRYDSDIRAKTPPNPDSVPSAVTFNAVIRAAANARIDGSHEELRDAALEAALGSYDAMHHHPVVERNSATYRYVLQAVGKCLPPCPSKGNIAYGLFCKACQQEGVLDETVVDAMMNDVRTFENGSSLEKKADSLGVDFDHWIDDTLKVTFDERKNGYGFPRKWSSNKRKRRYDKRFATY